MKIKKVAVIGYPINHSLSPKLHGYWLERYQISGTYDKIAIAPGELTSFLSGLERNGFAGCNITVPHKEKALQYMDKLTHTAEEIGAINTVVVQEDGSLLGDNTDAYGFINNLRAKLPDFDFNGKNILILGAGGQQKQWFLDYLQRALPR